MNYIVYRQEDEPRNKKGIWIHHKVYKDLSSPIVVQVYSLGMWQDINDIKPGSAIRGLGVKSIISLNKEEYESLVGKDSETLYLTLDYSFEEPSVSLYLGEMLVSDSIKSVTTNVEEPEYSESGPQVEVGQIVDGVLPMTFKHIQGPKGDTGDIGPKGEKGDQGNTGSSVDYPYELVNNVTTDDATKGLSAAQGVVLDGKISQLGQKVAYIEVFPNLFDKSNVIINKYYAGDRSTPTLGENTNYGCQLVEIPNDSSNYIMNFKDYQVDAFDENKQRISEVYFSAGVARGVPQGTKYLTISLQKTHLASYMLVEGDTLPESYAEFGTYLKNGLYTPKPKIYHVGIPATSAEYYEYQNLTALLKSLEGDDSEKIIYVHGGTYNVFQEYGGADYIASLTGDEGWRDVSVFVPNNTKIIGLGKVILSFTPTDAQIVNSHNAQLFSPLNVTGNCHIENIEIVGQNCRYCIHDEITAGVSENSRHVYKNVKMTKLHGIDGNSQAFGCGFGDGMYYEFDGCDICSYTTAFSMHNTDTTLQRDRSVIIIKNCHIHSSAVTDTPIVFRNSSTIQVEHLVNIYNTYIKGSENYVILKIDNPSGDVNAVNCFNVSLFGCNQITPSIVGISTENLYEVKQYNNAGWVFYNKKLVFNNDGTVTWVAN